MFSRRVERLTAELCTNLEVGFTSASWLAEINAHTLLNIWLSLGNYCAPFLLAVRGRTQQEVDGLGRALF